jgi:hypothetical protein
MASPSSAQGELTLDDIAELAKNSCTSLWNGTTKRVRFAMGMVLFL